MWSVILHLSGRIKSHSLMKQTEYTWSYFFLLLLFYSNKACVMRTDYFHTERVAQPCTRLGQLVTRTSD